MRYAVYISGSGTRIIKALETINGFSEKVKLIISDNEDNLEFKSYFEKMGIKYYLFNLKNSDIEKKTKNEYLSDEMLNLFNEYKIEYCFSFGKCILKGKLLTKYVNRIINFHPSILPEFPGFNAIDKAVEKKARYIGNTAHFIDESVDGGPIILQSITMTKNFLLNGYDAILDEQIALLERIDELLSRNCIHIVDGEVEIDNADYSTFHIYPSI